MKTKELFTVVNLINKYSELANLYEETELIDQFHEDLLEVIDRIGIKEFDEILTVIRVGHVCCDSLQKKGYTNILNTLIGGY